MNIEKIKSEVRIELLTIQKDLIILVDSREKEKFRTKYIKYWEDKGFKTFVKRLETGDYSFVYKGVDYSNRFSIDKKAHVSELIGNLTEERFKRELERAEKFDYFSFCVETGRLSDIYEGKYSSNIKTKSAIALLETMKNKFQVDFIDGIFLPEYIYYKIHYYLRSCLIRTKMIQ